MLYRSHDNLISGFEQFVASHNQVTLLTAYLKLPALEEINRSKHINQIVVRWQVSDLCGVTPASDLEEVWAYCKINKIKLYRNTRLHMKVLWSKSNEAIIGSANVTRNGLGISERSNYELASRVDTLGNDDLIYLNGVVLGDDSKLVTEDLYQKLLAAKKKANQNPAPEIQELHEESNDSGKFLTNQLPMFGDIKGLYIALHNPENLNATERNCLYHDIALYKLNTKMSESDFRATLESNFLNHPFIIAFLDAVRRCEPHRNTPNTPSMRFGAVEAWFAANTTEVPAPRKWELEPYVQVLYEWIQELSDGEFTWSVPGQHSQVLFYNG